MNNYKILGLLLLLGAAINETLALTPTELSTAFTKLKAWRFAVNKTSNSLTINDKYQIPDAEIEQWTKTTPPTALMIAILNLESLGFTVKNNNDGTLTITNEQKNAYMMSAAEVKQWNALPTILKDKNFQKNIVEPLKKKVSNNRQTPAAVASAAPAATPLAPTAPPKPAATPPAQAQTITPPSPTLTDPQKATANLVAMRYKVSDNGDGTLTINNKYSMPSRDVKLWSSFYPPLLQDQGFKRNVLDPVMNKLNSKL